MEKFNSKNKGFTLIELLIVVAIIGILAAAIMVSLESGRKNTRINSVKKIMKGVLPAIITCKDENGSVSNAPIGNAPVCIGAVGLAGATWPEISSYGYSYIVGPGYNLVNCNFEIFTNGDTAANLVRSCASQTCQ